MKAVQSSSIRQLRLLSPRALTSSHFHATRPTTACLFYAHPTTPALTRLQHRRAQSSASTHPTSKSDSESPAIPQTHYTFFPESLPKGPPPAGPFSPNLSTLKREFLQLQARAHPDLHPSESKKRAEALSARINEAYKTLQDPLLRAQYLLGLRGIETASDEGAKVDDPELLMLVLEVRELIEEAGSEEELGEVKEENDERMLESVQVLERAFQEDDLECARKEVVRLRYWVNIAESIRNWEKGGEVVLQH